MLIVLIHQKPKRPKGHLKPNTTVIPVDCITPPLISWAFKILLSHFVLIQCIHEHTVDSIWSKYTAGIPCIALSWVGALCPRISFHHMWGGNSVRQTPSTSIPSVPLILVISVLLTQCPDVSAWSCVRALCPRISFHHVCSGNTKP